VGEGVQAGGEGGGDGGGVPGAGEEEEGWVLGHAGRIGVVGGWLRGVFG